MRRLQRDMDENPVRTGMVMCCVVLMLVYVEVCHVNAQQDSYANGFSVSLFVFPKIVLLALVLWYTWRGSCRSPLPVEVPEWAALGAFMLLVANMIYTMLPKNLHQTWDLPLHNYLFPVICVGGLLLFLLSASLSKVYKRFKEEHELREKEKQALHRLVAEKVNGKDKNLRRLLMENASLVNLKKAETLCLIEECRVHIDPAFFSWLGKASLADELGVRDILYCILVRMHKDRDEICAMLGWENGAYRTFRSRLAKRFVGVISSANELETFLQGIK